MIKLVDSKCDGLLQEVLSNFSLDMVSRQTDYYENAAEYFGLLKDGEPSRIARHIFRLDRNRVFVSLVQLILEDYYFYIYFSTRDVKQLQRLLNVELMLNPATARRRSSTVVNWIKWCDSVIKENNITLRIDKDGFN
ncbi:MAG: hypothetical protein RBQ95_01400 [Paracholeplasma sp.]|nr:hypothetical protein [Paracholeplasma sp.]MDY3195488.1 hypothetical protein [Paracholeplasma sp.]